MYEILREEEVDVDLSNANAVAVVESKVDGVLPNDNAQEDPSSGDMPKGCPTIMLANANISVAVLKRARLLTLSGAPYSST